MSDLIQPTPVPDTNERAVGKHQIPVSEPDLNGNELKYVAEAIRSSWISSTGEYVARFERDFADATGARACVAVANGTVALHLAMLAHGVGPGDEVIVPSLTYIATANAVSYCGGEPVFVDVDPATWCIDPGLIEAAIGPRTKGIVVVHLYGHPADMDAINDIAPGTGFGWSRTRPRPSVLVQRQARWWAVIDRHVQLLREQDHHDGRGWGAHHRR